ncbi:hypothetical protein KsCSTR_40290 [Candidatus Kuenenia stuttgartiensis]|uniref:Uncharacterized protein n=1 Tax=Kuenenia stuttgartiensis TaxID=174633 RepID=Q1Q7Q3_KUEST|nr:hypothetical protein KsCSTR_40290 [Candidatus Kuenenia stuttgartiensis]CAJ70842.1 unknown protein [Candidatus Kuenenia stuttgartiensis]
MLSSPLIDGSFWHKFLIRVFRRVTLTLPCLPLAIIVCFYYILKSRLVEFNPLLNNTFSHVSHGFRLFYKCGEV